MPDPAPWRPPRLAGHPIHPALVHVPMGALPLAALFDVVALAAHRPEFAGVAWWCTAAGLAGLLLAAAAGFLEFIALPKAPAVQAAAMRHITFVGLAGLVFAARLLLPALSGVPIADSAPTMAAVSVVGAVLVNIGGWYGGSLVYRHRAGVEAGAPDAPGGHGTPARGAPDSHRHMS